MNDLTLQGKLEAVIAERDTLQLENARAIEALTRLRNECDLEGLREKAGFDCWLNLADDAIRSLPPAAKINQNDSVHLDSGKPGSADACQSHGSVPALTVWYGPMPESNGKSNFTAVLMRKDSPWEDEITIDRSEYPERVRYEADRVRYLIGELDKKPWILDYDADKHSGYVEPTTGPMLRSPATAPHHEEDSHG